MTVRCISSCEFPSYSQRWAWLLVPIWTKNLRQAVDSPRAIEQRLAQAKPDIGVLSSFQNTTLAFCNKWPALINSKNSRSCQSNTRILKIPFSLITYMLYKWTYLCLFSIFLTEQNPYLPFIFYVLEISLYVCVFCVYIHIYSPMSVISKGVP